MGALATLKQTLERTARQRQEQQHLVDEIQAPLKRLRALQDEERAAAEALAAAEAERAQLTAELTDHTRFLSRWEPLREKLVIAREVLEVLEDAASVGADMSHVNQYDVNRAKAGIIGQLEYIAKRQAERDAAQKRLKELT